MSEASLVGKTVGNYRILRSLGTGGMGAVYLGEHPEIESRVAIKILLPRYVANAQVAKRFLDEARAVNRIGHPGIVRIHDSGRHEELGVYLVMEYLEGQTLKERLQASGPLSPEVVARIVQQSASALSASHAAGIIHRDLKPANLFTVADPDLPGGERVKILDFGIAKLLEEREPLEQAGTQTGMVLGSPLYMSPEQCIDPKRVDKRTDIYSLGAIAYQLLTGGYPFEAETLGRLILKHRDEKPVPVRERNPAVPEALAELLGRMLEVDPERRIGSMRELRDALGPLLGERTTGAGLTFMPTPSPLDAPPGRQGHQLATTTLSGTAGEQQSLTGSRSRRGVIVAVVAVTLVAGGGVALWRLGRGGGGSGSTQPAHAGRGADLRASLAAVRPDARLAADATAAATARTVQLKLELEPASATVLLDGRPTTENPLVLERGKARRLRVEARGHAPEERELAAERDDTLRIALTPARAGATKKGARPEPKQAEPKKVEPRLEPKKVEPRPEPKKVEPRPEPKKVEPRPEPKKAEPKKVEPKKVEPKKKAGKKSGEHGPYFKDDDL